METNYYHKNGKLDPGVCRSKGLSASDVLKLRLKVFQLKEVMSRHRTNGQLIIVRMGDENPKYPIITDGVVQVETLRLLVKLKNGHGRTHKNC